jgi:hypothetical protein
MELTGGPGIPRKARANHLLYLPSARRGDVLTLGRADLGLGCLDTIS